MERSYFRNPLALTALIVCLPEVAMAIALALAAPGIAAAQSEANVPPSAAFPEKSPPPPMRELMKHESVSDDVLWVNSLEPLPVGGWVLIGMDANKTQATYASRRHLTRTGNVATAWFRYEFRQLQPVASGPEYPGYKSMVTRLMIDCVGAKSKVLSETTYAAGNLEGKTNSAVYDDRRALWTPAIPGTLGDAMSEWACARTSPPSKS